MTASTAATRTQFRFPSQRDLKVEIDDDRSGAFKTVFRVRASNNFAYSSGVRTAKYLAIHVVRKNLVLVEKGVADLPFDGSSEEVVVTWEVDEVFEGETFTTCVFVDSDGEVSETDEANNADCFTSTYFS